MNFWSKSLAYFSLPVLVILVASLQLYKVETSKLSRWKAGGFGMYTTINEINNKILINDKVLSDDDFGSDDNYKAAKLNFIYNLNSKSLDSFLAILENKYEVKKLQVYHPVFDSKTHQLSYKVRYEKNFE